MADKSSDVSNVEKFVICIRWVDDMLEPHKDFVGLHTVNTANAKNLSLILKDNVLRIGLSKELLHEQSHNASSRMMGKVLVVAQSFKQDINH